MPKAKKSRKKEKSVKIVSTTLTHNCEHLIRDALLSVVDWVDLCLVIDTGATDDTLAIAKEVAGDKYRELKFPLEGNFSKARNFALDAAHELGGDWAVTLDTDERILGGFDYKAEIIGATEDLLYVTDITGHYSKERFFKLPCRDRWEGPVHESFVCSGRSRPLDGIRFYEIAKSPEAYAHRFRNDIEALKPYIELHPEVPRWHFYLGESHRNLQEFGLAAAAYDTCQALQGWDEESAWACFRSAECLIALGRPEEALERLHTGLSRHAGIAELAWFAGYICYQLGRDAQAVYWSQLAIVHGLFRGDGRSIPRIGFRDPIGLWEGPYDVLRWAEHRRGNVAASEEAGKLWSEAKIARMQG